MYIILTQSNHYFLCNEKGYLCQLNREKQYEEHCFSANWKVIGLSKILPFGKLGGIESIQDVINKTMKYKNGKGMYMLHDYDHGTHRLWGDRIVAVWESNHV